MGDVLTHPTEELRSDGGKIISYFLSANTMSTWIKASLKVSRDAAGRLS